MKLGRIQKKYVAVIILVTALISSFVTYSFAGSVSSTLTLSAGVYPGATTYTFYSDGTNYYAKDQNGVVDYSGTDASTVLQGAVDSISPGGLIKALAGNYTLTSTIELDDYVIIEGEGVEATTFVYLENTGNAFETVGEVATSQPAQLKGFTLRGEDNAGVYGIKISYASRASRLENLYVINFVVGILLEHSIIVDVINVHTYSCNIGLWLDGDVTRGVNVVNVYGGTYETASVGIQITGTAFSNSFWGVTVEGNSVADVSIESTANGYPVQNTFEGCHFEATPTGVRILFNGGSTEPTGNVISHCDFATESYAAIWLKEANNTIIDGNYIYSSQYSVKLDATAGNNLVTNNIVGNGTILDNGVNSVITTTNWNVTDWVS